MLIVFIALFDTGNLFITGSHQAGIKAAGGRRTCSRAVCGMQNLFPVGKPPHFPNDHDFIFAVPAGDFLTVFGVYPQAIGIDGKNVICQQLLPLLSGAAAAVIQIDSLLPARLGVW